MIVNGIGVVLICGFALVGLLKGFVSLIVMLSKKFVPLILAIVFCSSLAALLSQTNLPQIVVGFLPESWQGSTFYSTIQYVILYAISFVSLFIGIKIVLLIIGTVVNAIAQLPILNIVNKIIGFVAGVGIGILLLLLGFYIIKIIGIDSAITVIEESWFSYFYTNNPITFFFQI